MTPIIDAWSLVVVAIAGWLNQEQAKVVAYLLAENKVDSPVKTLRLARCA